MNVGIVGNDPMAATVARRLAKNYPLQVCSEPLQQLIGANGGVVLASTLEQLARDCDVVVINSVSTTEVRELLFGATGLVGGLSSGKTVVDQTPCDPDEARVLAAELQELGITYVDAPIHSERLENLSEIAAITCGGPDEAVTSIRPLLEAICPQVIHAGESGNGQATRLVVTVVAACNRLIAYEAAATGFRNGLSVADMGTILSRCSGGNRATEEILPAIAAGSRFADVSLSKVAADLALASQLAKRLDAPMMIGNLARSILQAESNALGATAQLDDTCRIFNCATASESH
jgi:3-hydroxyisobutyrate dehydrogenase